MWPYKVGRTCFQGAVIAAGLDPKQIVRHTLRHTAITHLVQADIDLPTVQRISGHKTLQIVACYNHQNGERRTYSIGNGCVGKTIQNSLLKRWIKKYFFDTITQGLHKLQKTKKKGL